MAGRQSKKATKRTTRVVAWIMVVFLVLWAVESVLAGLEIFGKGKQKPSNWFPKPEAEQTEILPEDKKGDKQDKPSEDDKQDKPSEDDEKKDGDDQNGDGGDNENGGNGDDEEKDENFVPLETPVDGTAFMISPSKDVNGISATVYSDADDYSDVELADNERIVVFDTGAQSGELNAMVSFAEEAVSWQFGEDGYYDGDEAFHPYSVKEYVTVEKLDARTYKVTCLHPFGRAILLNVSLKGNLEISGQYRCDYEQRYTFGDLYIGFDSIRADGSLGRSSWMGRLTSFRLSVTEELEYTFSVVYNTSSYTIATTAPENCEGLGFEFVLNETAVERLGLGEYDLHGYEWNFDESLSVEVDDLFGLVWFVGCVDAVAPGFDQEVSSEDFKTYVGAFARLLVENAEYLEETPLYTLKITGLPETDEPCEYGVYFDVYDVIEWLAELDAEHEQAE